MNKIAIALLLTLLLLTLSGCDEEKEQLASKPLLNYHYNYVIVTAEGMPCLIVEGYRKLGVTCDWTQWEGR